MPTKITINNNGSLRVEGEFEIRDMQGKKYDLGGRQIISLCRCGHSSKKPFCDGSHKAVEFSSTCEAYALDPMKPKV